MSVSLGYVIIYVSSVPETIRFYETAFGLKRKFLHEGEDYGEMEVEGVTLSFTSHELAAKAVPVEYTPARSDARALGMELTLVTDNVDSTWEAAVTHGAVAVAEPHDEPWGQRVGYVRDLNGILVGIASPMG